MPRQPHRDTGNFPFRIAIDPNDRILHVHGDQINIQINNGPGGNPQPPNRPSFYTASLPRNNHNLPPNPNLSFPAGGNDNPRRGRGVHNQQPKAKHHNHSPNRNSKSKNVHVPDFEHLDVIPRTRSAIPDASTLQSHHIDGGNDNNRRKGRLGVNVHDSPDVLPHDRNQLHPPDVVPSDHNRHEDAAVIGRPKSAYAERIENWRVDVAAHPLPRARSASPNPITTSRTFSTESSITTHSSTDRPFKQPFLHHYVALMVDKEATIERLDDDFNRAVQGLDSADPDDQPIYANLKREHDMMVEIINNFTLAQCVGWIDEAPAPEDPNQVKSQDPDIYYVRLLRRDDPDEPSSGISVHPNDKRRSGMCPLVFDAYDKSTRKRNIQLPWERKYYHHWEDVLPVRILPVQEDKKNGYFNRYELSSKERRRFHNGSAAYFADTPSQIWDKRTVKETLFTMKFNPKFPANPAHPKLFTDLHDVFVVNKGR